MLPPFIIFTQVYISHIPVFFLNAHNTRNLLHTLNLLQYSRHIQLSNLIHLSAAIWTSIIRDTQLFVSKKYFVSATSTLHKHVVADETQQVVIVLQQVVCVDECVVEVMTKMLLKISLKILVVASLFYVI